MKKVFGLVFLLAALPVSMWAQNLPIDEATGKITYLEKVSSVGLTAKETYDVVKEWATSKGLMIESDEDGKTLKYQGKLKVYYPKTNASGEDKGFVHYRLVIDFKDGKYRIIMTDFVHEGESKLPDGGKLEETKAACGPTKMSAKAWVTIKNRTSQLSEELLAALKKRVQEVQNDPENNDNW